MGEGQQWSPRLHCAKFLRYKYAVSYKIATFIKAFALLSMPMAELNYLAMTFTDALPPSAHCALRERGKYI